MSDKPKETALPEFTLEEAKQTLFVLEEIATEARNAETANRQVLANLIRALHRSKVIDGISFMRFLWEKDLPHAEPYWQTHYQELIESILWQLEKQERDGTSSSEDLH